MHQIYYDNIQSDIKNLFIKREQNGYDTRKKLQFEVLYDRKSDPEAKVIPEITGTGPLIICHTGLIMLLSNTLY